jgi:hypothetical protein
VRRNSGLKIETWATHVCGQATVGELYPHTDRRVPHISLVFREMWDTTALPLKPPADSTTLSGCPTFAPALPLTSTGNPGYVGRKRWAKPATVFNHPGTYRRVPHPSRVLRRVG